MRHVPTIAAFACASLALGSMIALTVPTDLRPARNSELERLSQPKIVSYPGADRVINGPDSYPVTYSPQWLAVAEQAEREREAKWALPEAQPVGYDQPTYASDARIEAEGVSDVSVRRGASDNAPQEGEDLAVADQPDV